MVGWYSFKELYDGKKVKAKKLREEKSHLTFQKFGHTDYFPLTMIALNTDPIKTVPEESDLFETYPSSE